MCLLKICRAPLICSTLLLVIAIRCEAAPSTSSSPPAFGNLTLIGAPPVLALSEKLRSDGVEILSRLSSIEIAVAKASERVEESSRRPAIYALWTVVITGVINLAIQFMFMKHQRTLTIAQAQTEISNSFVEWQLKQLSELYGPLRALLGQSNVMYRHMNQALATADPSLFRLVKQDGDFDNLDFQIHLDGSWVRFRTVKHLAEVYGKGFDIEPYFDEVVSIGGRMVKLIEEKAGFARPDEKELVEVMGQYLAHYSVLSRLHERAKKGESPLFRNKADEKATFPIKLQELIERGFAEINAEVMTWKSQKPDKF